MNTRRTHKKNLIVSYKNLSDQLKELFMERYPEGYKEHIQRFEKPNGETIFVVPMETEDTVYMIKFDVKIDTTYTDDESEKDYFDEEVEKAETQFAPIQEALEKEEEDPTHREREVRHGTYDDTMESMARWASWVPNCRRPSATMPTRRVTTTITTTRRVTTPTRTMSTSLPTRS